MYFVDDARTMQIQCPPGGLQLLSIKIYNQEANRTPKYTSKPVMYVVDKFMINYLDLVMIT